MTQQLSSQVSSSPARNVETVVDTNPVLENQTNTLALQQSSAGTFDSVGGGTESISLSLLFLEIGLI